MNASIENLSIHISKYSNVTNFSNHVAIEMLLPRRVVYVICVLLWNILYMYFDVYLNLWATTYTHVGQLNRLIGKIKWWRKHTHTFMLKFVFIVISSSLNKSDLKWMEMNTAFWNDHKMLMNRISFLLTPTTDLFHFIPFPLRILILWQCKVWLLFLNIFV